MTKIHTTLNIEEDILKRAKQRGLNLSEEFEMALKNRIIPTKKELPEENLFIKCSLCRKEITEGYVCNQRRLVLCKECQENFPMHTCPHDIIDGVPVHEHNYFGERFPVKREGLKEKAAEITKADNVKEESIEMIKFPSATMELLEKMQQDSTPASQI